MRNVRLAEVLLSFVMSSERAAATVGDLVESARGPLGFWWACLRTASASALGQLSLGTGWQAIGIAALLEPALSIPFTMFVLQVQPQGSWFFWLYLTIRAAQPIFVGYVMARCLPGREIGGWIAAMLAWSAALLAMWIATPAVREVPIVYSELRHVVLLLPGVLLARRTTLRSEVRAA